MIKASLIAFILVLALVSCTSPSNVYDYPDAELAEVSLSASTVAAGEAVTVTVTERFDFSAASKVPVVTIYRPTLSACILDEQLTPRVGLCGGGAEYNNPGSVELLEGSSNVKEFADLEIRRGESKEIKHTFSFTSNEPAVVHLFALFLHYHPTYSPESSIFIGEEATVTFE